MPPKKLRKKRAKRSGKPQPLPRSVQALLQYLGGSDVKLGSSRPQRAQPSAAAQSQPQQQMQQQQMQYVQPPQAAKAAPKAAARPRGRPPKGTGNVIGQSPLVALAPAPQQIIMQQPAQQQQDIKNLEESQKRTQADIATMKVKQEENIKNQTPAATLAFFQQQAKVPKFMGVMPTRSENSAAAKQPSLTGTSASVSSARSYLQSGTFFSADDRTLASAEPNTPSRIAPRQPTVKNPINYGHMSADRMNDTTLPIGTTPSMSSARSYLQSMSSARHEGMMQMRAPSSQTSSSVISGGGGAAPDIRASAASSNVGDYLAQQFIQNVASPEQLATKKMRGRPPKTKAAAAPSAAAPSAAAPIQFEGQTAEQAIATFQAAKPVRKTRVKASAAVVLPQGVDLSTQVQMLAAGGAAALGAAAAPKQRRGRSLKELAKGAQNE